MLAGGGQTAITSCHEVMLICVCRFVEVYLVVYI